MVSDGVAPIIMFGGTNWNIIGHRYNDVWLWKTPSLP